MSELLKLAERLERDRRDWVRGDIALGLLLSEAAAALRECAAVPPIDRDEEITRLRSLLAEARAEVECWTPDECNAKASEERFLDLWYALRDRIDAALKEKE